MATTRQCLESSNYLPPPRSLWATSPTIRRLLFLSKILLQLQEGVTLATLQTVWVLNHGTPVHSSRDIMQYLHSNYTVRCIGRNGPVLWPPRSPEFTSSDLRLWSHLDSIVKAQGCNAWDELWNAIEAAGTIRNMRDMAFSAPGILGSTRVSYALTVMVDSYSIFRKPLQTGQMRFCSRLINGLRKATLFISFSFIVPPVIRH
jgi:hypothetical protein